MKPVLSRASIPARSALLSIRGSKRVVYLHERPFDERVTERLVALKLVEVRERGQHFVLALTSAGEAEVAAICREESVLNRARHRKAKP